MSKSQEIFILILLIIYILLMVWCFFAGEYLTIIKSFCILIGSFILGIIYAKLEDKDSDIK